MNIDLTGVAGMLEAFEDLSDAMVVRDRWVIGTNVPYAAFQEFGTSYQSGTPHLRPGFDAAIAEFSGYALTADDAQSVLEMTAFAVERETKLRAPVDTGHLRASYRAEQV